MFLSRLSLNPHNRQVRGDLGDCHELHRTLLSAWPDFGGTDGARAQCGLLYRVESDAHSGATAVLAQSAIEPDWSRLPADYLLCPSETKPIDGVHAAVQAPMRVRFRLRANPTKRLCVRSPDGTEYLPGKRVQLFREEEQIAWLERKGREQCGFRLTQVQAHDDVRNVRVAPEDRATGWRQGGRLTFGSALFDGELEVTDTAAFRQALERGIGSGKAYGFGLLSIARAAVGTGP